MKDVIVGIIIILIGALFCFRGWLAMRIVIPLWGAFAGFIIGAALIQGWTGDGFLSTSFSWIVGIVLAVALQPAVGWLERHRWNHTRAADELGLSRVGLSNKLKRYGIGPEQDTEAA